MVGIGRVGAPQPLSYVVHTTRHVGMGGEHGLAKATIAGALKYGVILRMTKSGTAPSGIEAHLPFYVKPPGTGETRTVEWYAKVIAYDTPAVNAADIWPIVLEDATGIYYGYGLQFTKTTAGSLIGYVWYRGGGGSWTQKAVTIDWTITDWNKYTVTWTPTQLKLYVNDVLKDTSNVTINYYLLPVAEMTFNGAAESDKRMELATFFDIYQVINSLLGNAAELT